MADAAVLTPRARAAALTAFAVAGVALLSLVPLADGTPPALPLGLLVAVAGLGALTLSLAAVAAVLHAPAVAGTLVRAGALWGVCGLALLAAAAAVAGTAQSLDLGNIVRAQANTSLYLFRQPAAAAVFVVAFVLAHEEHALRAVLGGMGPARRAAEGLLAVAVSALIVTLFLGGYAGPALPPLAWIVTKTIAVAAVLVLLRRRIAGLADAARLALAWVAGIVGLLNVVVTLMLVSR